MDHQKKRHCAQCGRPLDLGRQRNARFCQDACRARANRARARARVPSPLALLMARLVSLRSELGLSPTPEPALNLLALSEAHSQAAEAYRRAALRLGADPAAARCLAEDLPPDEVGQIEGDLGLPRFGAAAISGPDLVHVAVVLS